MMEKKFIWLAESCFPRRGPGLVKGEVHDAAHYATEVVEQWVQTGAARWAEESEEMNLAENETEVAAAEIPRHYRRKARNKE